MTFHVRAHGRATAQPLVFLHGVLAAAISYEVLCRSLATGRRVITIDQRGHGESDHSSDYCWERFVEDITLITDALGLTESFDLVGHSMGAGHAARFAALHPERVNRIGR